jgi:hypothetical protein
MNCSAWVRIPLRVPKGNYMYLIYLDNGNGPRLTSFAGFTDERLMIQYIIQSIIDRYNYMDPNNRIEWITNARQEATVEKELLDGFFSYDILRLEQNATDCAIRNNTKLKKNDIRELIIRNGFDLNQRLFPE